MKLFENGVGRPSNEIKKKRKIFIASAVILCIALVSVLAFALTKVSTNRLKGGPRPRPEEKRALEEMLKTKTTSVPVYTKDNTGLKGLEINSMWCNPSAKKCDDRSINLYFSSKGTYAKHLSYVICFNESDCKSNNAWNIAASRNRQSTSNVKTGGYTMYMKDVNKTIEGRTFYARITTYLSNDSSKWTNVYVLKFKPTKYVADGKNRWMTSSEIIYLKYNNKIINTTPKLSLSCDDNVKINEVFKCTTNQAGVKITVGGAKSLASGYNSTYTTTSSNKSINIKYAYKLFNDYKNLIKKDNNGKKYMFVTITASKPGYSSATRSVKITDELMLKCPSSVPVNMAFSCSTNISGATIRGSYAKELANGYKEKETATSKKFKYTKARDAVYIAVEKKGYKTVKKKVEIKNELVLLCPSNALVNKEFKCITNVEGTKISVSDKLRILAKNYSAEQLVKKQDLSAKFKIIESNVTVKVTASKKGFKDVVRDVKIYKK